MNQLDDHIDCQANCNCDLYVSKHLRISPAINADKLFSIFKNPCVCYFLTNLVLDKKYSSSLILKCKCSSAQNLNFLSTSRQYNVSYFTFSFSINFYLFIFRFRFVFLCYLV